MNARGNSTLPHGRYPFTATIVDRVLNLPVIFDFECEVDIETLVTSGELVCFCTDVLVDGQSLCGGSRLTHELRTMVMSMADEEIEQGGALFERIREAESLAFIGAAGDPDAHWEVRENGR